MSGALWRPVAGCGTEVLPLQGRLHHGGLESWRPGGLEAKNDEAEDEDADE